MPNKEDIIENIDQFSAPEIVRFVKERKVTIPEILEESAPYFAKNIRTDVENSLWDDASSSEDARLVELYLSNYPEGNYSEAARDLMKQLSGGERKSKHEIDPFADSLPEDPFEETPAENPSLDPWELVNQSDPLSLRNFIVGNPDHPKSAEANRLYRTLVAEGNKRGPEWLKKEIDRADREENTIAAILRNALQNRKITIQEFLELLRADNNLVPFGALSQLANEGLINEFQLESIGIDKDFIDITVYGDDSKLISHFINTRISNTEKIIPVCQEIYFWGMPSSGKTCALGAILSSANSGRIAKTLQKNECNGGEYMDHLSRIFRPGKISMLPTGTSASSVYDMSFNLIDHRDKAHSITLIDLAGEMLKAMYLVNQKRYDDLSPDQVEGYNAMRSILIDNASKNSKIHFFVLEYGGHERMSEGKTQAELLEGALTHIKDLGILDKTDGIFLLITKADKAWAEGGDFAQNIRKYVETYYQGFYNNLRITSKQKGINSGKIEIIPFSIGEVCFQDLCRFDDDAANEVVKLFIEITVSKNIGKKGTLINKLQG